VTNTPATLVVGWPSLEATPFNSYTASGMVVNLTNAGLLHDVFRGGVDTQLPKTATPLVQVPDPLRTRGPFVIGINGTVQMYTQFSAYQAALQADLAAGRKARSFVAGPGPFVDATPTSTPTLSVLMMATALQ